jgi:NAD(P)-dependent dehydrogenase (short-subunit alcohol dehydrogenase family)
MPEAAVRAAVDRFGRIDVLVNNVSGPVIRAVRRSHALSSVALLYHP